MSLLASLIQELTATAGKPQPSVHKPRFVRLQAVITSPVTGQKLLETKLDPNLVNHTFWFYGTPQSGPHRLEYAIQFLDRMDEVLYEQPVSFDDQLATQGTMELGTAATGGGEPLRVYLPGTTANALIWGHNIRGVEAYSARVLLKSYTSGGTLPVFLAIRSQAV